MTASKKKENKELTTKEQEEQKIKEMKLKIHDFMPGYAKEEQCFKDAIVIDYRTKKVSEDGWPYPKSVAQLAYERWLEKVVNKKTGDFYPKKDRDGIAVKGTGARYIINTITRIRDPKTKKEYLTSKGTLSGYNSSGRPEKISIAWPEKWTRSLFNYERSYDEKSGSFHEYTTGPSGSEDVYDMEFTEDNVKKLFAQTENEDVQFIVKDLKNNEARSVSWSSIKETLDLFIHKDFQYLFNGEYIPPVVRQELRQEAVAKRLISGVASDFQVQSPTAAPSYTS